MPMAGMGSRFEEKIKPLIDVNGVPMFVNSERCLKMEFDEYIFITRIEHNLTETIHQYYPNAHVIEIDYTTEGTACSVKLAQEHFKDGSSILISNCDQHIEWSGTIPTECDVAVAVFHDPEKNPKWSFAELDDERVIRVAEKDPISHWATVGVYYWKDGRDYISAADAMIAADDRVNNEFYTCPVINYSILEGKHVQSFEVDSMQGTGTPEDLAQYHAHYVGAKGRAK